MARKLRFFRDQMSKAGIVPLSTPAIDQSNLDDLEVGMSQNSVMTNSLCFLCVYNVILRFHTIRLNWESLKPS